MRTVCLTWAKLAFPIAGKVSINGDMLINWLQLAFCASVIAIAGSRLSFYGDVIADKTGLSGNWIGMILLASVTSLPELITGISASALADAPNIAAGNVLGSCLVNLAMLVVIDFLHNRESFYRRASRNHILSAGFGVLLVSFIGISILFGSMTAELAIGHVGIQSFIIVMLYAFAIRTVLVHEREQRKDFSEAVADRYPHLTLSGALIGYSLAASVVVAAGIWLPFVGTRLAEVMGWNGSFVGALLIAGATTLPELAVTISSIRIGALDMAIANLLGSNLFNTTILAVDDLFYLNGPIYSNVSPAHAFSALSAAAMTGLAVIGLASPPAKRFMRSMGWVSIGILSIYILNAYVLFYHAQ